MTIMASKSRKLPKVIWPIEGVNNRIRRMKSAKAMAVGNPAPRNTPLIRRNQVRGELCKSQGAQHSNRLTLTSGCNNAAVSIGRNVGVPHNLCPERNVRLDDFSKLRKRRALAPRKR